MINLPKIYLGPMTKNIIDAVLEYSNETTPIGLIPSRRQIDYDGGYVGFSTGEFKDYVYDNSNYHTMVCRDHGGIGQGKESDNGINSFYHDSLNNFDIIHIDPWKKYKNYKDGLRETIDIIKFLYSINPSTLFEVGTEEAIRNFSSIELNQFLIDLSNQLSKEEFNNILYVVIQSGTRIEGLINTGTFNLSRLKDMVSIVKKFGKLSKEHNGDYLTVEEIKIRFDNGLDALNIAPEFGVLETNVLLNHIINESDFNDIYNICLKGNNWKKWVGIDFNPDNNKKQLIQICGHYHNTQIKNIVKINDNIIKEHIKIQIKEKLNF